MAGQGIKIGGVKKRKSIKPWEWIKSSKCKGRRGERKNSRTEKGISEGRSAQLH